MPVYGRGRRKRGRTVQKEDSIWRYQSKKRRTKRFNEIQIYKYVNTPLWQISANLDFPISSWLGKRYGDVRRPVVVLDWGCGEGRALNDLAKKFKDKVNLYGFSRDKYLKWNQRNKSIAFIQETAENSARFFSKGSIDLVFSHRMAEHVPWPEFLSTFSQLAERLSVGGCIVMDSMQKWAPTLKMATEELKRSIKGKRGKFEIVSTNSHTIISRTG